MGTPAMRAQAARTQDTADPTLEQYRLAYRELRRPGWPPFDECMQDHTRRICLAGIARNRSRARWAAVPVAPSLPTAPVPPTPTTAPPRSAAPVPIPRKRRGKRLVDLKRAAANDRDDDTDDDDTDADQ